MIISDPNS